jgi:DNA invertase Pin-like site-specific DNA recombinase
MFIRCYLRASTEQQDSLRAKSEIEKFIHSYNKEIANFYSENISGTTLARPEFERLLQDAKNGDIILIEKMDRLTRLPYDQWLTLKSKIMDKGLSIVAIDQPMTHPALNDNNHEQSAIQQVLTSFMLDLGAAMARDDYETRLKRQRQGIEKAKLEGKYTGRKKNVELRDNIKNMLKSGLSYSNIISALSCSKRTIAIVSNELKKENEA